MSPGVSEETRLGVYEVTRLHTCYQKPLLYTLALSRPDAGLFGEFPADFKEPGPELLGFPPADLGVNEADHLCPGDDFSGDHDHMAP